jgi:hypothetical protein
MNALPDSSGQVTFSFGRDDRIRYSVQALNLPLASGHDELVDTHEGTLLTFDKALTAVERIRDNINLSDQGKEAELLAPRTQAAIGIAAGYAQTLDYDAKVDKSEEEMLKVPAAVGAEAVLEDQELRRWFMGLDLPKRMALVQKMEQGPELARLSVALLRGPATLMIADAELKLVRDLWDKQARMNDPRSALMIAGARATAEWVRRSLAHLGGLSARALGWDRMRILRAIVESKNPKARQGLAVYGLGEQQAALMQLQVDSKQFERVA